MKYHFLKIFFDNEIFKNNLAGALFYHAEKGFNPQNQQSFAWIGMYSTLREVKFQTINTTLQSLQIVTFCVTIWKIYNKGKLTIYKRQYFGKNFLKLIIYFCI